MKIFTAAVDKLYRQKFPNADVITWVSTTASDSVTGEPATAELPSPVDLSQSLIPGFHRNGIENGKESADKSPRGSNAYPNGFSTTRGESWSTSSPRNNDSRGKTFVSSRKTLSAKPVFSGPVASSTRVDAAASRRVMTKEDRKFGNEDNDPGAGAPHTPAVMAGQRDCQDGGGLDTRVLGGVEGANCPGSGWKPSNGREVTTTGGDDGLTRPTAGSVATAAAGVVDQRRVACSPFLRPEHSPCSRYQIFKTRVLY